MSISTLINNEICGYCNDTGHTAMSCPVLKKHIEQKRLKSKNTPFCSVCLDAGRPESEYTSHFVKDQPGPDGKVICPLLLSQKCRYCNETGHTPSRCHKLQLKKMKESFFQTKSCYYTNPFVQSRPRIKKPNYKSLPLKPIEDIHFDRRKHFKLHNVIPYAKWYNNNFIDDINYEEQIHTRLFPQTLYSKKEEDTAMKEADQEFEYLTDLERMQLCFIPKLIRRTAIGLR